MTGHIEVERKALPARHCWGYSTQQPLFITSHPLLFAYYIRSRFSPLPLLPVGFIDFIELSQLLCIPLALFHYQDALIQSSQKVRTRLFERSKWYSFACETVWIYHSFGLIQEKPELAFLSWYQRWQSKVKLRQRLLQY